MADETHNDAQMLALAALVETLDDARRARRFIELTGIGTDELRARAGEPAFLAELIRFLESHEPDLVAVSQALGVKPDVLVRARRQLEEGQS